MLKSTLFYIFIVLACGCSQPTWSIAVFNSPDLLSFELPSNASLSRYDICAKQSCNLADPFIVKEKDTWHLFFELVLPVNSAGKIALATSKDLIDWQYQGLVLDEPFHLSYPYVFKSSDQFFMIPESRKGGGIRLYHAKSFPNQWEYKKTIIPGDYADPSIVFYNNKWWIFAVKGGYSLAIFYSDHLDGSWLEHKLSPLYINDKSKARPGGRIIPTEQGLIRFAQDSRLGYGRRLRAFNITKLSVNEFEEIEVAKSPLLQESGKGWNSIGMHQFDAQVNNNSSTPFWTIVVDGYGYPHDAH